MHALWLQPMWGTKSAFFTFHRRYVLGIKRYTSAAKASVTMPTGLYFDIVIGNMESLSK